MRAKLRFRWSCDGWHIVDKDGFKMFLPLAFGICVDGECRLIAVMLGPLSITLMVGRVSA